MSIMIKIIHPSDNKDINKEILENKVMNKEEIIGKTFNLDLGSSPVEVKVIEITDSKVIVEYLRSTPGRVEEFSISDFENFAMIKIESYE